VLASRPISAIATRIFGSGIPIFMLHRMVQDDKPGSGHTPSFVRQCLEFLKENGHSFVSVEDVIQFLRGKITLPTKPVAFTMDDGFEDQATLAAPVFSEFNCPVTIFVITGMLDGLLWPWFCQVEYLIDNSKVDVIELDLPAGEKTFALNSPHTKSLSISYILQAIKDLNWDSVPETIDKLAHATQVEIPLAPPPNYKPITWDMARKLENQGICFGPHTVSHPILSGVDDRQAEQEITGSWQRINDELSSPSRVFCYPNGRLSDYGSREVDIIRKNGIVGAISTVAGYAERSAHADNLYNLPRFGLPGSLQDFIQYCTWIEYAKQKLR